MFLWSSKTLKITAIVSIFLHVAMIYVLSSTGGPSPQDVPGTITLSEIVTLERKKAGVLHARAPRTPTPAALKAPDTAPVPQPLASPSPSEGAPAETPALDQETSHHSAVGQTDPYIAEVIHAMNHAKKYPQSSIENEEQGVVLLLVAIERSGEIKVLEILKSSGFPRLDKSAEASVSNIKRFQPLPERFSAPQLIRIPIRYSISY